MNPQMMAMLAQLMGHGAGGGGSPPMGGPMPPAGPGMVPGGQAPMPAPPMGQMGPTPTSMPPPQGGMGPPQAAPGPMLNAAGMGGGMGQQSPMGGMPGATTDGMNASGAGPQQSLPQFPRSPLGALLMPGVVKPPMGQMGGMGA